MAGPGAGSLSGPVRVAGALGRDPYESRGRWAGATGPEGRVAVTGPGRRAGVTGPGRRVFVTGPGRGRESGAGACVRACESGVALRAQGRPSVPSVP